MEGCAYSTEVNAQTFVSKLSHINARGEASMVDVSAKPILLREALARG